MTKKEESQNLSLMILKTEMEIRHLKMNLRIFKHTRKELAGD
jgi:hypothetical protein